mmetsp:Transcript_57417/g.93016  ORF Transcript_57417/g.93016 Transcript_57417/m.93016 type:complete len:141 (-) Transcript_57417:12-434(-)
MAPPEIEGAAQAEGASGSSAPACSSESAAAAEKDAAEQAPAASTEAQAAPEPPRERKRRRGWEEEKPYVPPATSTAASAALIEAMVKKWVPTEKQLEDMSVDGLLQVLKSWGAQGELRHCSKDSKEGLLQKAKKIILGKT